MKKLTHFLFLFAILFLADYVQGQKIYWSDYDNQTGQHEALRANLDGSNVETLVNHTFSAAITTTSTKVYWTEYNKIRRANLDGSNMEDIVTGSMGYIYGIAISGSKMYWTEYETGDIHRANLDGSNIETLLNVGIYGPVDMKISGSKIYWADWGNHKLYCANLDGSGLQNLITSTTNIYSLAISGSKVYWTEYYSGKIRRANLDGSNIEDILTGQSYVFGLVISGNKMYWASNQAKEMRRADLDGSNIESILNLYTTVYSISTDGSTSSCQDNDNDGYDDIACGGDDCNDNDPAINPGAAELCDGIDNNCDGNIDEGLVNPIVNITESGASDFCQGFITLTANVSNAGSLQTPLTYLWSTGETTQSIDAPGAGNYSVVVTEGNGCTGEDDHDVTSSAWDVLGGYVMIGLEVDIDGNTVSGAGVGVTGAGEKARIRGGSVVNEFVKAPVISVSGGSSVGHQEIGQVTVTLPAFQAANPNSDDITVPTGGSMTITGSTYGEIEVKKNATLTIDAASVDIEDLDVADGGTVIFTQDCTIRIEDDFTLDEDCNFNTAGYFVVAFVGDRTTVDEGSDVHARIYSVDKIWVKRASSNNHTTMTGMFISDDKVDGDDYVDWHADASCGSVGGSAIIIEENEFEAVDENLISNQATTTEPTLDIFPNPARDILNIQFENIEANSRVLIYDAMGRLVWERSVKEGQTEIRANLDASFQNGLYVVSLVSDKQQIAKRLVINK